jgi:uncharacterized membrane protein (UPF0127 family)
VPVTRSTAASINGSARAARTVGAGGIGENTKVLRSGVIALLLVACNRAGAPGTVAEAHAAVAFGGGPTLAVRVADTPDTRATGLMNVMALPQDEGMAFVYDAPSTDTYWMKDTLIPLSIAFVAADGRIVTIRDMTPCRAEPCPTYAAAAPFTMAIETNLGWFHDNGVAVGNAATLEQAS